MRKCSVVIVVCLLSFLWNAESVGSELPFVPTALKNSRQLVLVLTPEWNAMQGVLKRYERKSIHQSWSLSVQPIHVVVGKNGMAWGEEWVGHPGQIKREGDGRSPAGAYALGTAFGLASDPHAVFYKHWPYFPLKASSICVDDETSPYYNQLMDSTTVSDWDPNTSGEHMLNIMPQYTWGNVIRYNSHNKKGAGSCIFMHVWRSPNKGTAGCVAMAQEDLVQILSWLDPTKKPAIVLFPSSVYRHFQRAWNLPKIK